MQEQLRVQHDQSMSQAKKHTLKSIPGAVFLFSSLPFFALQRARRPAPWCKTARWMPTNLIKLLLLHHNVAVPSVRKKAQSDAMEQNAKLRLQKSRISRLIWRRRRRRGKSQAAVKRRIPRSRGRNSPTRVLEGSRCRYFASIFSVVAIFFTVCPCTGKA